MRIIVKDTTLTTQCFFVCFIFIGLNTTSISFVRYLQIELSLVLITHDSTVNARNCLKATTHTTRCFLFVLFSSVLLQQVLVCKIPANQIIISTYS